MGAAKSSKLWLQASKYLGSLQSGIPHESELKGSKLVDVLIRVQALKVFDSSQLCFSWVKIKEFEATERSYKSSSSETLREFKAVFRKSWQSRMQG